MMLRTVQIYLLVAIIKCGEPADEFCVQCAPHRIGGAGGCSLAIAMLMHARQQ